MKDKSKLVVLISGIVAILVIVIGVAFAFFTFEQRGTTSELVLGDIWMKYEETNGISLDNALPGDAYSKYFQFTVTGKNTYTEKDIWYDINIVKGDVPQDKTEANRIEDKYLKFRLVEVNNNIETEIFTDKTYDSLESQRVHVATIPKATNSYEKTYRLYMVISENLVIGDNGVISNEDYGNLFGSVKVKVTGDFEEKELSRELVIATTALKEKVVTYSVASASDFSGGLVAINGTEGNDYGHLYNENNDTHTIREYRYSGADVDNYIYYNCADTAGGKNYGDEDYDYASNCEVWRIVGIFDENGEQFLKIMNHNTLTDIPTRYNYDDTTHRVGSDGTKVSWNYPYINWSTNYNDWTRAGLQYYLNTEQDNSETPVAGYLGTLSTNAKNLIRETTHYLGYVDCKIDTVISAYASERNGDNIWPDSKPTWNGKIGLLYPSDYGYSASNTYWETDMYGWYSTEEDGIIASSTSWMMQTLNHASYEWLLSPSSSDSYNAMTRDYSSGYLSDNDVRTDNGGVRPVLNLKSNTKILKGDGDVNSPYVIIGE